VCFVQASMRAVSIVRYVCAALLIVMAVLVLSSKLNNRKDFVCAYSSAFLLVLVVLSLVHSKVTILSGLAILLAWVAFGLEYFDALTLSLYAQSCMIIVSLFIVFCVETLQ
jgi:hypothetical protein